MAAEIVASLAGGAVLAGWAIYLGSSHAVVGLLGALPFLAQALQIPSTWITVALGRRRVALVAIGVARQMYWALVPLPFIDIAPEAKQAVLLWAAGVAAIFAVVGNNAWLAWISDLVPAPIRGRFFGRRAALGTLGSAIAALCAAVALDHTRAHGMSAATGYVLAAASATACVAGLISTVLMARQHEPAPLARARAELTLATVLEPLRHPAMRRALRYQLVWNGAIGTMATFVGMHMLQNLHMSFVLFALHDLGVAIFRVLAAPVWGRAVDRVGARPVLVACSFGIALIPILWLFPTPEMLWPILMEIVVSGMLWSGHAVAAFGLPLAVAPVKHRALHLAAFAAAGGVAFAAASATAGLVAQALPEHVLVGGHALVPYHVLFALSAIGRFAGGVLATRIIEPRAHPVQDLVRLVAAPLRR